MALYRGSHRLKSRLCKPDYSIMVLALDLDPALANKAAQHHFPCPDWKAVGQLPVGPAHMLHDCSLGHVCAFAWIDGHFPFAFSPALQPADCLKIACWCNRSRNVRMRIIRCTPSCRAEISGEGKARGYDEANGEPAHASLPGV